VWGMGGNGVVAPDSPQQHAITRQAPLVD
jgi:hypothetical protein